MLQAAWRARHRHGWVAFRWLAAAGLILTAAWLPAATVPADPTATSYAVSLLGVESGLPTNSAVNILETRDGYIWIGTEFGLSRFDGVRFQTYRSNGIPALPSNRIRGLFQDRDGAIWIATQNGVTRFRDQRFERVGLEGAQVSGILQDRAGRIWAGTDNQGLWEFRDGQFISHANAPGMPPKQQAGFIYLDASDRLWVCDRGRPALLFENGRARPAMPEGAPFSEIVRVCQIEPDTFLLATDKGLFRLRDGQFRHYTAAQGAPTQTVNSIYQDQAGRVWLVATTLHRLDHVDAETLVRVPVAGVENCRSMLEDREGTFWVGSSGDGVARLRQSGFRMASPPAGLFGGHTRTAATAPDGSLWAGLEANGAARIAPDGTVTPIELGGINGEVWSICHAADGRVWLGTRGALRVWRDGRIEDFPQFQRTRALYQDRSGTLWIGSETEGITSYREGVFTSRLADLGLPPTVSSGLAAAAMAFAETADGTLYIGVRENGGLLRLKDGAVTRFAPADGFPTTEIRAIYPDADGHLWLGTRGQGLVLFSEGRWYSSEKLSEPFNYIVAAIQEDSAGRLWLGTPTGIMWGPKAQLLAMARDEVSSTPLHRAQVSDGVRPGVVGAGSFPVTARTPDGRLWFGSRRGLISIDPEKIRPNLLPPPVHIERVLVDQRAVPLGETIALPAGARSLAIEYTALSFVAPTQMAFRHRLEGRDEDWVEAGTHRTALYSDLPPGDYRFRVIACNDDGVWNETGASIAIVQRPFFYQTRWFLVFAIAGLAGGGLGIFRWRTASLKRRNAQLEAGIVERTAELAKSYETLRASEYFYQSLVQSLPQIIVRKDTEGRYTYANAAFAELVNLPLTAIIGRQDAEIYPPAKAEKLRADDLRAMATRLTLEFETVIHRDHQPARYLHVKKVPLYDPSGQAIGVQILFWDTTTFREIEEKLKQAQREIVETSRLAGIAEMATGILHNLGNALNSVNTTAGATTARIRNSRVASLAKVSCLLAEHHDALPEFLTQDPRGRQLPSYLAQLGEHLLTERDEILADLRSLQESIDHIKELVASQQQHARATGVTEIVPAAELIEYALRISEASLKRHHIDIVREFTPAPPVTVERQKALQIIGNLIANARDALDATTRPDKRLAIGVRPAADGRVQVYVTDNGIGIAPDCLTRIFRFGFTTKKDGHGFGLHSSALAAREMGGALRAQSEGPGQGSTFVLELPAATPLADFDSSSKAESEVAAVA